MHRDDRLKRIRRDEDDARARAAMARRNTQPVADPKPKTSS